MSRAARAAPTAPRQGRRVQITLNESFTDSRLRSAQAGRTWSSSTGLREGRFPAKRYGRTAGGHGCSGGSLCGRLRGTKEGDRAVANIATVQPDTFPKLLIRNAEIFGTRPAIRHKDLGIWQSWTWAQVVDEVRALSVGLDALGLKRGDKLAIIGHNRPRLYWAMAAGQALGAVPVPLYVELGRGGNGLRPRSCGSDDCDRRGSRAGRQGPVALRPAAEAGPHRLRRDARPARLRPRSAEIDLGYSGNRPRPVGAATRTR